MGARVRGLPAQGSSESCCAWGGRTELGAGRGARGLGRAARARAVRYSVLGTEICLVQYIRIFQATRLVASDAGARPLTEEGTGLG